MNQGKDKKVKEVPSMDSEFEGFDMDAFSFNNRLSLPKALKEKLTEAGMDWRFLNAQELKTNGGMHRTHWRPYKASAEDGIGGLNPEGFIARGDLILGIRPKKVSQMYRQHLNEKNQRQAGFNKNQAAELKKLAREHGVEKEAKIHEGYDENE